MDWPRLLAYITGTVDQELLLRNEYLVAENRILKAQIKARLRLSDAERTCLPEKPHGRLILGQPFSTTAGQRARARLLFCSSRCLAGEPTFSRSTPFRFCLL